MAKWVITYGIDLEEASQMDIIPDYDKSEYSQACDELRSLIEESLADFSSDAYISEDHRDGETFSVRIVFSWRGKPKPEDVPPPEGWKLLELKPYSKAYGEK